MALLVAACAPAVAPTVAPTQTLIPPTVTSPPSAGPALPSPPPEVLIPAAAQSFVSSAIEHLATALNVSSQDVSVVTLEAATWTGDSEACESGDLAGYRIVLYAGDVAYTYRTGEDEAVFACDHALLLAASPPTASADPLAAELVLMAQQRLADELDLSTRRIRVVSVEPRTWTDTSMNCPSPDTAYETARIPGYRVVLEAGEAQYIFHSDFDRLIACSLDQEAQPEGTSEALQSE